MPRLRRSDSSRKGIARRRRGRGFEYLAEDGIRVTDPETLARIRALAIPPAWQDVWICTDPWGHLQAVGTDAAGRRQYLYHERWRARRDQAKYERMLEFARSLPALRRRVVRHLVGEDVSRRRVLACAVRLLDRGFFRIGSEGYAEENQTYGLATLLKRHARVKGRVVAFDYRGKGGQRHIQEVMDPDVASLVRILKRRRGGGADLLAYRVGRRWVSVRSSDINDYLKEQTGGDFTAKDFRTWNGTLLAAVALAGAEEASTKTARKRAMREAVKAVAEYLGNTPAVCRASYIDPRVFDRFETGVTIRPAVAGLEVGALDDVRSLQGRIEEAVLDLLDGGAVPRAA